jgi:hypothetical protein
MTMFLGEDVGDKECVGPVGYINEDCEHAMMTFVNPTLVNAADKRFVQIVVSIDSAILLRAGLNAFLTLHGVRLL